MEDTGLDQSRAAPGYALGVKRGGGKPIGIEAVVVQGEDLVGHLIAEPLGKRGAPALHRAGRQAPADQGDEACRHGRVEDYRAGARLRLAGANHRCGALGPLAPDRGWVERRRPAAEVEAEPGLAAVLALRQRLYVAITAGARVLALDPQRGDKRDALGRIGVDGLLDPRDPRVSRERRRFNRKGKIGEPIGRPLPERRVTQPTPRFRCAFCPLSVHKSQRSAGGLGWAGEVVLVDDPRCFRGPLRQRRHARMREIRAVGVADPLAALGGGAEALDLAAVDAHLATAVLGRVGLGVTCPGRSRRFDRLARQFDH